ncbi:inositol hexakisphosphate kinase 1-like [Diadema antillarum]|uniref:inositol hexakisphosphate kinase 1-like n=1 Tax=Diadema antillarum TaxID=105358 RepID=UPI003A86CC70
MAFIHNSCDAIQLNDCCTSLEDPVVTPNFAGEMDVEEETEDVVESRKRSPISHCVLLMPFEHQVGGHAAMMKCDEKSVCKIENANEVRFYQRMPNDLAEFVPVFKGLVDVYVEEGEYGRLSMKAYPVGMRKELRGSFTDSAGEEQYFDSDEDAADVERRYLLSSQCQYGKDVNRLSLTDMGSYGEENEGENAAPYVSNLHAPPPESTSRSYCLSRRRFSSRDRRHKQHRGSTKPCCWVRVLSNGNLCVDVNSDEEDSDLFEDQSDANRSVTGVRTARCNPWSMYCQRQQLMKMRNAGNPADCFKFMVMEDCTANFHFPCILDIKIGTRSHADHVTEDKRKTHIAKCASTTSATMGVRVAGMQVFHVNRGTFVCRNKYYGRRLSEQGLREALGKFLFNGRRFRFELIPHFCKTIRELVAVIKELPGYRFYGSSLLLTYEGLDMDLPHLRLAPPPQSPTKLGRDADKAGKAMRSPSYNVSLKMIDFASSSVAEANEGPDYGYIYGLQNLRQILQDMESNGTEAVKSPNSRNSFCL